MTTNSNIRNEIELNELSHVVGGASTPTLGNPLLAAAQKLSAIQSIHLPPLPPLHVAVPHF
jgi:hypothetical protein